MTQILVPTTSFDDWQRLLADPAKHWKPGYSAMTLAKAWEANKESGFPPEIARVLQTAGRPDWNDLRPIIAIPEYEIALPGGSRSSQTDLACIAHASSGLLAIAVEGKVNESFGPQMGERRGTEEVSSNKRLAYLCDELELETCPDTIRYQLLHRSVSALLIAREFFANSAVMLVHSFSPTAQWLNDFNNFVELFGKVATPNELVHVGDRKGVDLYLGWVTGQQEFRS